VEIYDNKKKQATRNQNKKALSFHSLAEEEEQSNVPLFHHHRPSHHFYFSLLFACELPKTAGPFWHIERKRKQAPAIAFVSSSVCRDKKRHDRALERYELKERIAMEKSSDPECKK